MERLFYVIINKKIYILLDIIMNYIEKISFFNLFVLTILAAYYII